MNVKLEAGEAGKEGGSSHRTHPNPTPGLPTNPHTTDGALTMVTSPEKLEPWGGVNSSPTRLRLPFALHVGVGI